MESILIIDDDRHDQRVLARFLKGKYQLITADNAEAGTTLAAELKPTLILLDVVMPHISGFEIITQLKENPDTQNIPVIFTTGLDSADEESKGFQLGAVDYIHKPFNPGVVQARIATQIKLIKQQRRLTQLSNDFRDASEAKSRFVANMSHEIRTPLTTIAGYAESILRGDIAKESIVDNVEIIANSSKHLISLINQVLDFSKIEAGELNLEKMPVDMQQLVNQVYLICAELAKQKGIAFFINCQPNVPAHIYTDPTRVKQVLINLISNAIKFTHQGSVTFTIGIQQQQLEFAIKDTGIGIAKDKLANLFGAFNQGEVSTNRQYGGTGLGLAISRNLTQQLGGDIRVSSQLGVGSEFVASIKADALGVEKLSCIHLERQQNNPTQITEVCLRGHVLLAEDHPQNQRLFAMILKNLGLQVTCADDGKQAFEQAISNDFDLLLLDIQMPIMDGIEAIELIRASGIQTPAIALTATAVKQELLKLKTLGFDNYLTKPMERTLLIEQIKHYLPQQPDSVVDSSPILGSSVASKSSSGSQLTDPQIFESLREEFREGLAQYSIDLNQSLAAKDTIKSAHVIHKLKGAAATFKFDQVAQLAADIERQLSEEQQLTTSMIAPLIDAITEQTEPVAIS